MQRFSAIERAYAAWWNYEQYEIYRRNVWFCFQKYAGIKIKKLDVKDEQNYRKCCSFQTPKLLYQ